MEKVWQKNYMAGVPAEINPDHHPSLLEMFEHCCQEYDARPAFSNLGVSMTYRDLELKSRYFANYLQQHLKLQKGQRVALMMPNLLQYPVALFGILRAGLVAVNINPLYTAAELQHLLNDSGAETIVVVANFAKTVEAALPEVTLKHIIITEIGDLLGGFKKILVNFVVKYIKKMVPSYQLPEVDDFVQALSIGKKYSYQKPRISPEDMAFLQYTGGTTGRPKAAVLTHRNMLANVEQCVVWIKPILGERQEIVLGALPLYHIFSLTVCCMTFMRLGSECLLITNPRDMKTFINTLSKVPVSIFIGINTLLKGMMHRRDFHKINLTRLKLTVAGGMAMEASIADEWQEKTGVPVVQGYGLTEASPVVTINPINIKTFYSGIGLPVPSTDVQIRDEDGHALGCGEKGELCVKGPQVMQGYWQQAAETEKVLLDGWLLTGDIAQIDEQGFIEIVDRKKDMILVSGFNVYPAEIEAVLSDHPDIEEVAVVGVPSQGTGEAVKAFIVKNNPDLNEETIIDYCHQFLTAYKIPKQIEFCDELPKSHVGKVLRRALRT